MSLPDSPLQNPYSYDGAAAPVRNREQSHDEGVWIPPIHVTLHNGEPMKHRMRFRIGPSDELGKIYTASSDENGIFGRRFPFEALFYVFRFEIPLLLYFFAMFWSFHRFRGNFDEMNFGFTFFSIAALTIILILIWQRFQPSTVFLGENGYCKYRRTKNGYVGTPVLFRDCESVQFARHTFYSNRWRVGMRLQECDGTNAKLSFPRTSRAGKFDYDVAIELAFTQFLLRDFLRQIDEQGYYDFSLYDGSALRFTRQEAFRKRADSIRKLSQNDFDDFLYGYSPALRFVVEKNPLVDNQESHELALAKIPNSRALLIMIKRTVGGIGEYQKYELQPSWFPNSWDSIFASNTTHESK